MGFRSLPVMSSKATQIVDENEYSRAPEICYGLNSGVNHAMRAFGDDPWELIDVFQPAGNRAHPDPLLMSAWIDLAAA